MYLFYLPFRGILFIVRANIYMIAKNTSHMYLSTSQVNVIYCLDFQYDNIIVDNIIVGAEDNDIWLWRETY
jgi:hypothetical protein